MTALPVTLRANFTVLFVRTLYVRKKTYPSNDFPGETEIDYAHSAKREFPEDTQKLELLITREVFVQSVHSSRVLVNFNQVIGRYWKQEV